MAKRVSMRQKREKAPEWVFPWRGTRESKLPKFAAAFITLALFALLFAFVRIRVATPTPWAANKASLIQVLDDPDGRSLTLLASEGGPFPSRFDPAQLEWVKDLERSAYQAARSQVQAYTPALRTLPEIPPTTTRLATPGKAVLPRHRPPLAAESMVKTRPQPVLYPLAGLSAADLPENLPDFPADVPPAMAAESWRFLLRLDDHGRVLDVVSLAGTPDAGQATLEAWLHGVKFAAAKESSTERWVAIGLGFINQPNDGTDAH